MMKKSVIAAAVLCIAAGASLPAKADEPCNMTLCMWGQVAGAGKDGCQEQIKKFYKKQVKKKGSFLPDHTADARKDMLMQECPASMAPAQFINDIIKKFGRLKG